MTKGQMVGIVTFGVFFAEAMIHYNIGVKRNKPEGQKGKFVLPPQNDLVKIAGTVALFSLANVIIIDKLAKK